MTLYDSIKSFGKKAVIYPLVGLLGVITVAGCVTPKPAMKLQNPRELIRANISSVLEGCGCVGISVPQKNLSDSVGEALSDYRKTCKESYAENGFSVGYIITIAEPTFRKYQTIITNYEANCHPVQQLSKHFKIDNSNN